MHPSDDIPRQRQRVEIDLDTVITDLQERTVWYVKTDSRHPNVFVRYGPKRWAAKVGRREIPVESEKSLWVLERLFQNER